VGKARRHLLILTATLAVQEDVSVHKRD